MFDCFHRLNERFFRSGRVRFTTRSRLTLTALFWSCRAVSLLIRIWDGFTRGWSRRDRITRFREQGHADHQRKEEQKRFSQIDVRSSSNDGHWMKYPPRMNRSFQSHTEPREDKEREREKYRQNKRETIAYISCWIGSTSSRTEGWRWNFRPWDRDRGRISLKKWFNWGFCPEKNGQTMVRERIDQSSNQRWKIVGIIPKKRHTCTRKENLTVCSLLGLRRVMNDERVDGMLVLVVWSAFVEHLRLLGCVSICFD